jgi:hypothetical protein
MSIWTGIKSIFGFDGVGETALKIVDKIAGTDWTAKERAQFTLEYMEKTRYQSQTRRMIATLIAFEWFLMSTTWLFCKVSHRLFEQASAGLLAGDIQSFMVSDVNILMNALIGFYFVLGVKK